MTNTQEHERPPVPPVSTFALGWALSATFVVLFVLCAVAVFAFPQTRFSHAWLDLFTQAPVTSMRAWLEGLLWSVVLGWIAAVVFAPIYNRLNRLRRRP